MEDFWRKITCILDWIVYIVLVCCAKIYLSTWKLQDSSCTMPLKCHFISLLVFLCYECLFVANCFSNFTIVQPQGTAIYYYDYPKGKRMGRRGTWAHSSVVNVISINLFRRSVSVIRKSWRRVYPGRIVSLLFCPYHPWLLPILMVGTWFDHLLDWRLSDWD